MARASDVIGDMFTRIRNAIKAKRRFVDIPLSKHKKAIADVLKGEGFVESILTKDSDGKGLMRMYLKYAKRDSVISDIQRSSRPGCRLYVHSEDIPMIHGGMGMAIVSTSQGVLSGQEAKKRNIGGELIGYVW